MYSILVAFIAFISTRLASLIVSLLAPSFGQFLNLNKNKREKTLRDLEEAYSLAKQINTFCNQCFSNIIFLIDELNNQLDLNNVPKTPDEPFSRMDTLLDYHLKAPADLIKRTKALYREILHSFRPIAEAINSPDSKDSFYYTAVEQCLTAVEKAPILSNDIITWVISEKNKIEDSPSFFQKEFWLNLIIKIKNWIFIKHANKKENN